MNLMLHKLITMVGTVLLLLPSQELRAVPVSVSTQTELPSLSDFNQGVQDRGGWLWLATNKGLYRYDGNRADVFRTDWQHPMLLGSNNILCVIIPPHRPEEVWFGTKKGAYVLNRRTQQISSLTITHTTDAHELEDKRVSLMLVASDGTIWLSYRHELLQIASSHRLLQRFALAWNGRSRAAETMVEDSSGCIWLGLWNGGLCRLLPHRKHLEQMSWRRSDYPVDIQSIGQMLYITTSSGLYLQCNIAGKIKYETTPAEAPARLSLDSNEISRLSDSQHQCVYIGTFNRLYCWNVRNASLDIVRDETGRVHDMVMSCTGRLYYLSERRGVCSYQAGRHRQLSSDCGFKQMRLDGDSVLWLSDELGRLARLPLYDRTLQPLLPRVGCVALDDTVWLTDETCKTLSLSAHQDRISLYISTFDYMLTDSLRVAYRMGKSEWMLLPQGVKTISLSDIPVGRTSIAVRVSMAAGTWSGPTTLLTLHRACGWQWWAPRSLLFLLFAVSFAWWVRRRTRTSASSVQVSPQPPVSVPASTELKSIVSERLEPLARPNCESEYSLSDTIPQLSFIDQEFLTKISEDVLAHLQDPNYSVDTFSANLCMSRMNLYRKVKSITGQTPTEYIRNLRLERAALLLRTTAMSINEISERVGFAYSSYFTKCFKDKYGISPKDYVQSASAADKAMDSCAEE